MAKKISNEAVKKSTGKVWKDWFLLLNKAGAKKMEHKDIAKLLYNKYALSGWWSQMVAVQYEQDVKGRKIHEKPKGFQISKSFTVPFSLNKVYNAVSISSKRADWLQNLDFEVTKSTKNKSIRGKWIDRRTNIEFQFYPKKNSKTQMVVQQSKIKSAKEAEKMKRYWGKQLYNLKKYLEKN